MLAVSATGIRPNYFTVTGIVSNHWKKRLITDDDSSIDEFNCFGHPTGGSLRSNRFKYVSRIFLRCKDDPDEYVEVLLYDQWAIDSGFINTGDEVNLEVSHCQVRDMRDEIRKTAHSYSISLQPDETKKSLIFIRVSQSLFL
jgi:hypothetical protein